MASGKTGPDEGGPQSMDIEWGGAISRSRLCTAVAGPLGLGGMRDGGFWASGFAKTVCGLAVQVDARGG
jgi:hypothetical protein